MDAAERRRGLVAGQRAFAGGDYFGAHEHWERVWLATAGDERRWLQALIQAATALHKLAAGRADLCQRLLDKALAKLADAPPAVADFDVGRFVRELGALRAALAAGAAHDWRALRLHDR